MDSDLGFGSERMVIQVSQSRNVTRIAGDRSGSGRMDNVRCLLLSTIKTGKIGGIDGQFSAQRCMVERRFR